MLKKVILFLLIFCTAVSSIDGQNWQDGTRKGTKIVTFEPPGLRPVPEGYTEAAWQKEVERQSRELKQEKLSYELLGKKKMEYIKRYFETLTSNEGISERRKEATERRLKSLFIDKQTNKMVPYRGTYLDKNLRFKKKRTTLVDYITYMQDYTKKSEGLISVCWNFGVDTLNFERDISSPIGQINGKLPVNTRITKPSLDSFYHHYKAEGFIKEEIAFFHNNETTLKTICKAVDFSLCFLEVELEDGSVGYDWIIYVSKIDDAPRKACGDIESEPCKPTRIDSTYHYEPVEPYTYLVPGLGWKKKEDERTIQPWMGVTALTAGALGAGLFYKIRSDNYYRKHQQAATFRELDDNYAKANNDNQRFIISASTGLAIWLISDLWIFFKDKNERRKFNTMFPELEGDGLKPTTVTSPTGEALPGIKWVKHF